MLSQALGGISVRLQGVVTSLLVVPAPSSLLPAPFSQLYILLFCKQKHKKKIVVEASGGGGQGGGGQGGGGQGGGGPRKVMSPNL